MSEWRECKLGNVADFKNGKSRPTALLNGEFPIYGGNGVLGHTNTFNYQDATVIIGRVGAYCGSVFLKINQSGFRTMHYTLFQKTTLISNTFITC